jgi:phytanoyl-CoA hydroxylase
VSEPERYLVGERFRRDGFVVARGVVDPVRLAAMRAEVVAALDPLLGPAEFEADVGYPGAPRHRDDPGGHTARRLLRAASRFPELSGWARSAAQRERLAELTGSRQLWLSQCHHNCVMTKHPGFSSSTAWHQDIRYWSFDRPELISAWLALGAEHHDNGALWVIPGSHVLEVDRGRFDHALFLRTDLPDNEALIGQAVEVGLEPGDVLFFHCRLFHAAGTNLTDEVKLSGVFTYHAVDNRPIPGTRSDQYPPLEFDDA